MELNLYRRHLTECKYSKKGQNYTQCACPIWAYGRLQGRQVRKSVGLRDWSRAIKRVERWEENPAEIAGPHSGTVPSAAKAYLADCRARKLADSTITSYGKVLEHLSTFCTTHGVPEIQGINLDTLTAFRAWRNVKSSTQRKEIEALRSFCGFALKRKWIKENWAKDLKPPKETTPPTMPFTPEEMSKLIEACDNITNFYAPSVEPARLRAKALVLLLAYSGLRISDAIKLERHRLNPDTGRLMLRAMKTGVPIYVRLHQDAVAALLALPAKGSYFLWSGKGKLSSATGSARRTVDCLARIAGISANPHRFRDTFAVELLKAGTDIRTVQLLLGHGSITVTERHYAPFVSAFQTRLDSATAMLSFGKPVINPQID